AGTGIGRAGPIRLSERLPPIAAISHPRDDVPLLDGGGSEWGERVDYPLVDEFVRIRFWHPTEFSRIRLRNRCLSRPASIRDAAVPAPRIAPDGAPRPRPRPIPAKLVRWARLLSPEARNAALIFLVALVAGLFGAPPMVVMAIALVGVLLAAWAVRRRGAEL